MEPKCQWNRNVNRKKSHYKLDFLLTYNLEVNWLIGFILHLFLSTTELYVRKINQKQLFSG